MRIEEDTPDYFEGEDLPDVVKEKKRKFHDDDPRRWMQPASKWEHLSFLKKWRIWGWVVAIIAFVGVCYSIWVYIFEPEGEGCVQYGYVESIERQNGKLSKSFEGVMIPYREIMDTTRIYSHDFQFSTTDPAVAAALKKMMLANVPAVVEYTRYRCSMPWRGTTRISVTGADSINPSRILPPEYQPESLPDLKKPNK